MPDTSGREGTMFPERKLRGGPYAKQTVKLGNPDPPITGIVIFPDRMEVQGEKGIGIYALDGAFIERG